MIGKFQLEPVNRRKSRDMGAHEGDKVAQYRRRRSADGQNTEPEQNRPVKGCKAGKTGNNFPYNKVHRDKRRKRKGVTCYCEKTGQKDKNLPAQGKLQEPGHAGFAFSFFFHKTSIKTLR
jgi:hypothetical protein